MRSVNSKGSSATSSSVAVLVICWGGSKAMLSRQNGLANESVGEIDGKL